MGTIGIDIGTTTISGVVLDQRGALMESRTVANEGQLAGSAPWERIQDPRRIWEIVQRLLDQLLLRWPDVEGIGVTGQQHGILYLDAAGEPVSPLYTWQDQRAGLERTDGESYAAYITRKTGYAVAPGYGLATHFYNVCNGLVPAGAKTLCTIPDYIAAKLSGQTTPRMDPSHAASLGLFDGEAGAFSREALGALGLNPDILPAVGGPGILGKTPAGRSVSLAIGDNQSSFIGATGGRNRGVLVNMGTGGQISIYVPEHVQREGLETRPFPLGGSLLVGASLCGGRSYALLEQFFRQTVKMVTGEEPSCYGAMERLLEQSGPVEDFPRFQTTFAGTRQDPNQRGAITGISTDNFTPLHWIYGMMHGMAEELYELYRKGLSGGAETSPEALYGAGNGLRRNPFLRAIVERRFGCAMTLSPYEEEAACGAALFVQVQGRAASKQRGDGDGKRV